MFESELDKLQTKVNNKLRHRIGYFRWILRKGIKAYVVSIQKRRKSIVFFTVYAEKNY